MFNQEQHVEKQVPENHGEGNPEAADRFNKAEQEFVASPRGKQKIREGAKVRPEDEQTLAAAEQAERAHAKSGDAADSKVMKKSTGGSN